MLAVIHLDHYIGCAVEGGITSRRKKARLVISSFMTGCVQLMHVEAFAMDVPSVDHCDEPAHSLGPFQIR